MSMDIIGCVDRMLPVGFVRFSCKLLTTNRWILDYRR